MIDLEQFDELRRMRHGRQLLEGETPVILIVDDDPSLRTMLVHVLNEDGYRVVQADSGLQAIELAASEVPHLILMDAIMVGMTGFEATRIILEEAGDESPLIMVVTGLDDDSSVIRAYDAGATDYITKPIHWAVLRNRITHLVQSLQMSSYRKVAEARLRNANKMETIGKLTGGIAHDFNNILSSIIGYTELAITLHQGGDDKLGNYLNEVAKSSDRAKRLIQQMMTFCRGDTIEPQHIDAREGVYNVVKMLRATLPSSIEFKFDIEEGLPRLYADFIQLEQALMNLCVNARDAIGESGVITIGVHQVNINQSYCASCQEWVEGPHLEITVGDNGTGIADSVKKDLFVPFISTKKATSGTGLGLSVVDGIMHGHKGHILVESIKGRGTTFSLLFPVVSEGDAPGEEK